MNLGVSGNNVQGVWPSKYVGNKVRKDAWAYRGCPENGIEWIGMVYGRGISIM